MIGDCGQQHDITQAEALIAGYEFERLIADRSYDSEAFVQILTTQGPKQSFLLA